MMKIYKRLYYNLYCIWLKKNDESENAHINAVITITFSLYVNIMNVLLIIFLMNKKDMLDLPELDSNVMLFIGVFLVAVGIFNYVLLGRKEQHNKIIEEFESEKDNKDGLYFTLLYILISFGMPFFILFF